MKLTEKGLIKTGIIKTDGKHNMLNAIVDCSGSEYTPIKGIWIEQNYYPAVYVWGTVYFDMDIGSKKNE